jgi:DNA-binding MarR family transcriptional regulator
MTATPAGKLTTTAGQAPGDRLADDLGWGLAVVFRAYVKAADAVTDGIPGGHRGYQVLVAAARDEPGSQAALAQRLGIDRTVMTYLLDDIEAADLVARQPDPLDRRSRRVAATEHGRQVLADLETRFRHAEQRLLAGLAPDAQPVFRALLRDLAAHANALDPVATACDAITDLTTRNPG